MAEDPNDILLEAEFDVQAIIRYRWVSLIPIACFIVTIPFVLIAAVVYKFALKHIVRSWSATLTSRSLIVRKGIFTKIDKTIPLEKITDLGSTQGPIMRRLDLKQLTVETAGQSAGAAGGALISLIGIRGTDEFRRRVLAQRDLTSSAPSSPGPVISTSSDAGLDEIAATLLRIESSLDRLASRDSRD